MGESPGICELHPTWEDEALKIAVRFRVGFGGIQVKFAVGPKSGSTTTGFDVVDHSPSLFVTFNCTTYVPEVANVWDRVGPGPVVCIGLFESFIVHSYCVIVTLEPSAEEDDASNVTDMLPYTWSGV